MDKKDRQRKAEQGEESACWSVPGLVFLLLHREGPLFLLSHPELFLVHLSIPNPLLWGFPSHWVY